MSATSEWTPATTSAPPETLYMHTNAKWGYVALLVILPPVTTIVFLIYLRMDRKKTNVLNLQLAFLNLVSAFVLLPMFFAFHQLLSERKQGMLFPDREKSLDHVFCGTLAVVYYLTTSLHFTTLLALSIDRFVAVYCPFIYRGLTKDHYMRVLGVFWTLTTIVPCIGLLPLPVPTFQYLPAKFIDIHRSRIFCEIVFSREDVYYGTEANPGASQKVYCFIMMGVPFVIVPIVILVMGLLTMTRLLTQYTKRRRQRNNQLGNSKRCLMRPLSQLMNRSSSLSKALTIQETVIANVIHSKASSDIPHPPGAELKPLNSRQSRRIDAHIEACVTLFLLLITFLACDSIWWLMRIGESFRYMFKIGFYNQLNLFETTEEAVYGAIAGRSGIFVYATLVPAILIWRQKSFRDEFLSIFKDARTMATELTTYNV